MSQHSEVTRGRAIGYFECGKKPREISVLVGANETTVRRWIRKHREGGDHALRDKRKENRGKRKTSSVDDQQLLDRIEENPFANVSDIVEEINYPASVTTGLRRLHVAGIHCRRPARKIPLTPAHREQRVGYAIENLTRSRADWVKTIWTDEKVFISSASHVLHVWRANDTRLEPNHVVQTHRSGRASCGVWGWISGEHIGDLVEISPHMNSHEYVRILEEVFLPSVRNIYPADEVPVIRFVQDNSGVHTSRETRAWFERHPEIDVVNWPARSPDLNPIENVWALMARRWIEPGARTRAAVLDHARSIWEGLRSDREFLANLTNSMPNRLSQVIDRNGYWTDY